MSTAVFERKEVVKFAPVDVNIRDTLIVSPDRILLCNESKGNVQLVDTREGRVLSEVSLPCWLKKPSLRRLCLTRKDQATVTVKGNKVQMINVQGQSVTLGKVLTLNYDPWGVSTCGDNDLVVSYHMAPWLEVISTEGSVCHQFHQTGPTSHFKYPDFLTTSLDGYVYVSDWGTKTITKLDSSLHLIQTFSSPLLDSPYGIISISPDQLLVCSHYKHSVVLLNTRTGKSSTLLGLQDGIILPYSLGYCPELKLLYICRYLTGRLKVYKV